MTLVASRYDFPSSLIISAIASPLAGQAWQRKALRVKETPAEAFSSGWNAQFVLIQSRPVSLGGCHPGL